MDSRVMCPHPKIGPARPKTVVLRTRLVALSYQRRIRTLCQRPLPSRASIICVTVGKPAGPAGVM